MHYRSRALYTLLLFSAIASQEKVLPARWVLLSTRILYILYIYFILIFSFKIMQTTLIDRFVWFRRFETVLYITVNS